MILKIIMNINVKLTSGMTLQKFSECEITLLIWTGGRIAIISDNFKQMVYLFKVHLFIYNLFPLKLIHIYVKLSISISVYTSSFAKT